MRVRNRAAEQGFGSQFPGPEPGVLLACGEVSPAESEADR